MWRVFLVGLVWAMLPNAFAAATELKLTDDRYRIALASRKSADEAIAYARRYSSLQPSVVSSINGWYAVVVGPRAIAQGQGKSRP